MSNYTITPDIIKFNTLFSVDKLDRKRVWNIYVRLIKTESQQKQYDTDWNVLADTVVSIDTAWIDGKIPKGILCCYWTETGIIGGKLTRNAPTFTETKNAGKKNEKNVLKQGIFEAERQWTKYVKAGWREDGQILASDGRWFPMLAQRFDEHWKKLSPPYFVQPKLNGHRCIAHTIKPDEKSDPSLTTVDLYTRKKEEYTGFDDLRKQLTALPSNIFLDGELYGHGIPVNDIQSWVSDESKSKAVTLADRIRYHVYDLFMIDNLELPFHQRKECVDQLISGELVRRVEMSQAVVKRAFDDFNKGVQNPDLLENFPFASLQEWRDVVERIGESKVAFEFIGSQWLVRVPTLILQNKTDLMAAFYIAVVNGYEGIMVRNPIAKYQTSKDSPNTRTVALLKFKPIYDSEFMIVGFTKAKGAHDEALIWICKIGDRQFNVTPLGSIESRRELYRSFIADPNLFVNHYQNVNLTVEYREMSEYGVPQHAKGLGIRKQQI